MGASPTNQNGIHIQKRQPQKKRIVPVSNWLGFSEEGD